MARRKAARKGIRDIVPYVRGRPSLEVTMTSSEHSDAVGTYYEFDFAVQGIGHFRTGRRVEREDKEPYDPKKSAEDEMMGALAEAGFDMDKQIKGKYHFRRKNTE